MTAELIMDQEVFQSCLSDLFHAQNTNAALSKLRLKGWERFNAIGLPTRQIEAYQYVPLSQLFSKKFAGGTRQPTVKGLEAHVLPECRKSLIVLVNGQYDPTLSCIENLPKNAVCLPIHEALRSFGLLMQNQIIQTLQVEKDPFAALNSAFMDQALFLYLPPHTVLETPIQIVHLIHGEKQLIQPRVECFFGSLVEAHIISTHVRLDGQGNFNNSYIHFMLEQGAKVKYERAHKGMHEWHFDTMRAHLKRDASLKTVIVQQGDICFRDDYRVSLLEPNAEATLSGISMLSEKWQSHTHVLMEHMAPECSSNQLFKAALAGFSQASFEGKIYVHKEALKTAAFQLNNFLLLSDHARSNSKPNLEIFADDVKASHGATVGQLNDEELFYLQTRGLALADAKNVLIRGFCHEVISSLSPILQPLAADQVFHA